MAVKYHIVRMSPKSDKYASFKFICECGDEDHDLWICVEPENRGKIFTNSPYPPRIYLQFEKSFKWCDGYGIEPNPLRRWKKRISVYLKLLFKGEIEIYEEMIMDSSEHIQSFIDVLEECKEMVEKGERDENQKV